MLIFRSSLNFENLSSHNVFTRLIKGLTNYNQKLVQNQCNKQWKLQAKSRRYFGQKTKLFLRGQRINDVLFHLSHIFPLHQISSLLCWLMCNGYVGRIRKQAISDGFLIMKRIEIKAKKLRINSLTIVNKNKRFLNIIRMNGWTKYCHSARKSF